MRQMSTTSSQIQTEVASVTEIRRHFPALERVHNGYRVAYFDGPGGTQVPRYVVERMNDYLYHHNANTHWAYPTSAETDAALAHAREVFAEFLNASPTEIAFGSNMTTLTLHLSRALGMSYQPGDEIVVTELEHHANLVPWQQLCERTGATLRWFGLTDDGRERGLLFICLNADIARQFEFIQQTWLLNRNFATLYDETDPLMGPKGRFTIPEQPLRRIVDVQTFIQLAGGEYFFLPSLPALRYLASPRA